MSWPSGVPDVRRGTRNIKDPFDSPGTSWVHMLATGFYNESRGAGISTLNVLLSLPLDLSVDKGVKKFDGFLRGCSFSVIADYGNLSQLDSYVSDSQYMRLMLSSTDSPACMSGDVRNAYRHQERVNDEYYFQRINKWLESGCSSWSHDACVETLSGREIGSGDTLLPRRCVRVAPAEGSSDGYGVKPVLVETEGMTGRYICLSHRWSQPQTGLASTVQSNYQPRCLGTGFDSLPKLFNDVFAAASKLQVSYIWIDSLCIIQDDADDWKREAARMGDYYQNAFFTIATASPNAGEEGLFTEIETPRLVRLPYRDQAGGVNGSLYMHPNFDNRGAALTKLLADSELLSRGWYVPIRQSGDHDNS